jgi:Protein of unknown function (DUF2934)
MASRRISDSPKSSKPIPPKGEPGATPAVTAAVHAAPDTAPPERNRKRRATAKKDQEMITASAASTVSEDQRRGMIALSAYLRAERRGFSPEGQAEDWLAAEKEVDALLNSGHSAPQ